ncbi:flagellar hook-associated protein FlgL [Lysinibacillus sp. BW-2-10]|uniref:flagellar hook-associated protein FlgL n=1 Tax=Lysinibacillus sp. BW-2-10 TaxID=2590030 RepID=UPI00117BF70E|nr:flagellar hook-associated protein FlgL [Lysinibacillus sp. BW-2-10]TSI07329.1 flagellar hook-associated protein FlgL [Lysinibacillus sp. BW-2-10]
MRVTQSMLSNNMLRNLSSSYSKMDKLQKQIETGKKINRPSDDPVVAMKGMGYRTNLNKVEQFQRNIGELSTWLEITDDTLDKVGSALHRANELAVQASNDTMNDADREKIKSEYDQLREHIQMLANTKNGDKYIFSGTKTATPLYDKATGYPADPVLSAFKGDVKMEVFDGLQINANTTAVDMFKDIDKMFADLDQKFKDIENPPVPAPDPPIKLSDEFRTAIASIDAQLNSLLEIRADIGARQNRVDLMNDRLSSQEIISTKQMSENEDVDYEKAITNLITQESIHNAALSVGSRIIQPTLVDFIR